MSWRLDLPGLLGQVAEIAGEAAAVKLCLARGGHELNIPSKAAGSELARILGDDAAAAKVIAELGPGRVRVPMGGYRGQQGRRRAGMQLMRNGASNVEVARACDVSLRAAENWRGQLRAGAGACDHGAQASLFDRQD
ncbi:MAG: hypothetical protein AAF192_00335 [Pseudomonadota bacterium]